MEKSQAKLHALKGIKKILSYSNMEAEDARGRKTTKTIRSETPVADSEDDSTVAHKMTDVEIDDARGLHHKQQVPIQEEPASGDSGSGSSGGKAEDPEEARLLKQRKDRLDTTKGNANDPWVQKIDLLLNHIRKGKK